MSNEARGTQKGWGVVCRSPFHLAAIFAEKEEAEAKASEMGGGYEVEYGENPGGTNEFLASAAPTGAA